MSDEGSKDAQPEHWVNCTIGDITLPVDKIDPSDDPDRVITYIDISGIDNVNNRIAETKSFRLAEAPSRARQIVKAGDVLFATVRPYLRNIASVRPEFDCEIASTGFSVLRPANGVEPSFLFYKVISSDFVNALSGQQYGVSYPAVNDEQVRAEPISLPPTEEQTSIVAKIDELFSELDKGIEGLKTAREQLKVYRQAVLKHAFEGKLTKQWREVNKGKLETSEQLLERIKREREAHYQEQLEKWKTAVEKWEADGEPSRKPAKPQKPSDLKAINTENLPALPEGWLWVRYGDLCALIRNGISQKPDGTSGAKIFRISAVRPMEFDLDDVRYIDNKDGQFDQYYLQFGDLVFTRYNGSRAYVGVCAEYKSDGSHLYPDKLIRTQLATSSTLPGYIEKAVNCGESRKFIELRIRTTAGQSGVSGTDIKNMPIPVCCTAQQAVIQSRVDAELSRISRMLADIEESLCRSESLRQSILKQAFSGQLVAQDPNDEPASDLLERIKAGKAENGNKKKNNKRKVAA